MSELENQSQINSSRFDISERVLNVLYASLLTLLFCIHAKPVSAQSSAQPSSKEVRELQQTPTVRIFGNDFQRVQEGVLPVDFANEMFERANIVNILIVKLQGLRFYITNVTELQNLQIANSLGFNGASYEFFVNETGKIGKNKQVTPKDKNGGMIKIGE